MPRITTPAVSIVMTMYNEAAYVAEAVESVRRQTFSDFELIVVDDGSTDGGASLVERCDDPRIRIVRQENAGLAAALNHGIRLARAPWIARHDADDVSEPERIAHQMQLAASSPDLVLIGTNALITDEAGEIVAPTKHPADDAALRTILFSSPPSNPFIHGSVLMRRDAAIEAGLYRTEFRQAQDYEFWLRLAPRGRIANVPQPLYRWRMRRGNVAALKGEDQRDYGQLALLCAERRANGEPEPPLELSVVQRKSTRRFFTALRSVDRDMAYEFTMAKVLVAAGHGSRGRKHAFAVIHAHPLNAYAWFLVVLSLLPLKLALRLLRAIRGLYVHLIWQKRPLG